MFCRLVSLALFVVPGLVFAQTPAADAQRQQELAKKPQWQRFLKGEDVQTAEKLENDIEQQEQADTYLVAIQSAKDLLALRVKVQGADHNEAVSVKYELSRLETLSALVSEKRREWGTAVRGVDEARSLMDQGQYLKAFSHVKRFADLCRELLGEDHPDTATSYNNLACNLDAQRKVVESLPLHRKALDIRRKVLGADHPDTANSYNNMASNLLAQGKAAEAEPLFQKGLDIHRKILGEDHPDTAGSYNNVAKILTDLGKAAEAGPLFQKALDIHRKVLGEDHPATATSYNNVAMNLRDQGKGVNADLLFKRALNIRRKVLGENHSDTVKSYIRLATNLRDQGNEAEAEPLYRKVLDIRLRTLGENHPDTVTAYNNLAANLLAQGKAADAKPLFQKALEIRLKVLGEEHPDTARSYNNLAMNLKHQGKAAEAAPLLQNALDIKRKILGEDHLDTANSYSNVGLNLNALGRHAEATPLLQKALEIRRKVLGEDHPDTAVSYINVAGNLGDQGRAAEGEPLLQKALYINRKTLGENHPDTANSYNNMASNLLAQGKAAEAEPLFQKGLEIHRKVLGEDHPDTAGSYNNVAKILNTQGKTAEAAPLFQRALEIRRKVLGEEHPDTATSYNSVAFNLDAQGKAAKAAPLLLKALGINRRMLGEDHPDTANSYNSIGCNLMAQGKGDEAGLHLQKALEIRRKTLGENHPDTASSYNNVAMNLNAQGRQAEATPLLQKALDICRKVLGEDHPDTASSYNNIAFSLVRRGHQQQAIAALSAAIPAFESSRLANAHGIDRATFTEANPRFLLAALQQTRNPATAWMQLEFAIARGLLDQQGAGTTSQWTPSEQHDHTIARTRLAAIQSRLFNLVTATNRVSAETEELNHMLAERAALEATVARLAVAESERAVELPGRIRASLPEGAALLYWIDVTSKTSNASNSGQIEEHWACVVRTQGDPKWERLPGTGLDKKWTKEDSALPNKFRTALTGSAAQADVELLSQQLYAQRIEPMLAHLEGVKTLYVISVNVMAGIPIEALTSNYTISYIPSGTFLARRGSPLEKPATLFVLGDPSFPAQQETTAPTALPPGGLLVKQVLPGGPAAKALLKPNDVLVSYADTKVETVDQLRQVMTEKAGEKSVAIQIWREVEAKLATYEMATGNPGFVLAREPAREAIASRRKVDQLLAKVTRGEWVELPGSQVEVSELAKLFEPGNVTTLTRSEASEPDLNQLRKNGDLTKSRYLHFATHGEANDVRAFDSKLILAQDHPTQLLAAPNEPWLNNELTAREVLDYWKLDADLVTLSACETAIGRDGGGDGLLGFAQAFLLAGSRSVCLSLWKVDDTATALLMDRFYRNLLGKREDGAKPMGKAAALHEAKNWLKTLTLTEATDRLGVLTEGVSRGGKKGREVIGDPPASPDKTPDSKPYTHPKFWAAFIIIGDPD